ncbi:hypothetical protein BC831DRAFT_513817 [Entophlyctis helioformis]|nr:hypothetical protein BC831DRAFT_513817 [Entophlyctis helioformis]
MEAAYIKQTVGPTLAKALTELLLTYPYTPSKHSSYDTHQDPIAFLSSYLLQHTQATALTSHIKAQSDAESAVVGVYNERLREEREDRARFMSEVRVRVAERARAIDKMAQMPAGGAASNAGAGAAAAAAAASAPVQEPVTEEAAVPSARGSKVSIAGAGGEEAVAAGDGGEAGGGEEAAPAGDGEGEGEEAASEPGDAEDTEEQ